jgi:hypothetical protein
MRASPSLDLARTSEARRSLQHGYTKPLEALHAVMRCNAGNHVAHMIAHAEEVDLRLMAVDAKAATPSHRMGRRVRRQ